MRIKVTQSMLIIGGAGLLIILLILATGYDIRGRGIPFIGERTDWTIGIYTGSSPFELEQPQDVDNPVLTFQDVTDVPAKFVADPFLIRTDTSWYLFFEVWNQETDHGDIALATSPDGKKWEYQRLVIDEPFHLAYPYVFFWEDEYYLVPDSYESEAVRLYRATAFPYDWRYVTTLVEGLPFVDSSLVHFADKWWLFTSLVGNEKLLLYFADELEGPWQEHPLSPIVDGDKNIARPGGRILNYDGRLIRYAQDSEPTYGSQIWALEITELTETTYAERLVGPRPVVKPSGSGWNESAMHTVDPHQVGEGAWISPVDGVGPIWVFGPEY